MCIKKKQREYQAGMVNYHTCKEKIDNLIRKFFVNHFLEYK